VRAVAAAFCLLAGATAGLAQEAATEAEASRPWMLGFAAQTDDLGGDSLHGSFNWAVTEDTWLSVSTGRSRFADGIAELDTRSLRLGFDHTFGRWGVSFDAETWGDAEEIESTDLSGTVHFGGERFRIYFEWESRDIELSPLLTDRIDLDVSGEGLGARLRFNFTDDWRLYVRGMSYDYEWTGPSLARAGSLIELCTDAPLLADRCDQLREFVQLLERRNLFIQSTLANNSFLDSELALSMEWQLGRKLLNIHLNRDRAANRARSRLDTVGASILFPVSYRMDLELSVGRSESDVLEPSTYGGLFVLLYGG
jgi:hypothetical protein